MSDEELERELRAVNSKEFGEIISSEKVSVYMKEDLIEHRNRVIAQNKYRDEGCFIYPLTSFGLLDF